ncbi:hypothetical protein DICSQDRAFT_65679, partial [Dichomitus squalens LYAD-421 SS1]
WNPPWDVFQLDVFRGFDHRHIEIHRDRDDAALLRELASAYDELRTWSGKYFSFMDLCLNMRLQGDNHAHIVPRRMGTEKHTPPRNACMRYLLKHPEHQAGNREIVRALTEQSDRGVEFVERPQFGRILWATIALAFFPLFVAVVYSCLRGDWAGGFTIGCEY